jgi:transposase
MVRDPQSGKYRRTRLFVMTLGHSRKPVRLLVFRSNSRVWAELHEKAFRRLGGATRVVVLDKSTRGRANTGHLRSQDQPAVWRRIEALRRGRFVVPGARSGSKRQG